MGVLDEFELRYEAQEASEKVYKPVSRIRVMVLGFLFSDLHSGLRDGTRDVLVGDLNVED